MKEIVVLYSGGTDSTCAAALIAEGFDKVHLLTYRSFGFSSIANTKVNVKRLKDKFGEDKFVHKIIDVEKIFKNIAYSKYFYNLIKYKFFLLTTCGFCKLAFHIRSLIYCLENNIKHICDGVDKNLSLFPTHIPDVKDEISNMYSRYGITYIAPVYELKQPRNIGYLSKLNLELLDLQTSDNESEAKGSTTGEILYKMGILPVENVKGTKMDRKMQYRCFQFILFYIFARWYYLPTYGYQRYKEMCLNFYKEKMQYFEGLIDEYLKKPEIARLSRLL